MKTLRLIYMAVAAIFLVASCDDDSMNTDKAKVSTVFGNGQVEVVVTDTSYNLSWEPYTIYAGGRLAICTQYDVFVTPVYFDDTQKELYESPHYWHPVTTVDSCCARVSKNSVDAIFDDNSYFAFCVFPSGIGLNYASYNNFILSQTLNSSGRESVLIGATADPTMGHVEVSGEGEENMRKIGETVELTAIAYEGYKFKQWSDGNTDNPRKLLVTEDVYLEAWFEHVQLAINSFYDGTTNWFTQGTTDGVVENKVAKISIDNESLEHAWNIQFCVVLTELEYQTEDNDFVLMFDVKWEPEDEKDTEASFRFVTGYTPVNYLKQVDYQWANEDNTEIIFGENNQDLLSQFEFHKATTTYTHYTFGGKIGPKGKDRIGIEIDLAGIENNNNFTPNPKGKFLFTDMVVTITNKDGKSTQYKFFN